ncbi:hypothetical protein CYLTODRAFT_420077 [Cylindrobasidium torrendii FP15055 ss-10]|uniref:Uncharacterized protein n=1 Tax=Cylindrobasidium torrendii FP15055 ss-10 TaxID=1314674 RepID=A0A0D7BJ31_9AGAR|nr:hypothetical protein CYLTODRAFT_420077 [Cylindrobasidium torrendii FP15055 ss-10]
MDISLDDNFSRCMTGQFFTNAFNHMVPRVEYSGGVSPGAIGSKLARSENSTSIQSGLYDLLCLGKLALVPSDSTLLKILEVVEQNRELPLTKRVPFNDPQIPEFDPSLCVYSLSVQRYKGNIFTRNPKTGEVTKYTHPYPSLPHITTSANPWLVVAAAYNAVTTGNMGLPLLRKVGNTMLAREYPDDFEPVWPSLPQSNACIPELKSDYSSSNSSSLSDSDTAAKQETVDTTPDSEDVEQVKDTHASAPAATQDAKRNVTNAHLEPLIVANTQKDPSQYQADEPSDEDSDHVASVENTQQSVASPDAKTGDNAGSAPMESHVATDGQEDASPPTSNDDAKIGVVEPVEAIEPAAAPLTFASEIENSTASAQPEPQTLQDRSPQPASEAGASSSSSLGITTPVAGIARPQSNSRQSLSTRGTKKRKRTQGNSTEERGSSSGSSSRKKTRQASEPSSQPQLRRAKSLSGLALTRCIR